MIRVMDRPETLPDFDLPPVTEVVLGIQFDRIPGFQTIHAGKLWEKFSEKFPIVQEHPPSEPTFETFGTKPVSGGVQLELMSGPLPMPKLWFLNEDQTELIQFQPDRFVHNWRKVKEGDVYPRYERIRSDFISEIECLQSFFLENNLGLLQSNQCEITYVNHILSHDNENIWDNPEIVFKFFKMDLDQNVLGQFENSRIQLRFILNNDDGIPFGRLHVNAMPALTRDGKTMIALSLTVRGSSASGSLDAAANFLDFGRTKIVEGFAELTTEEMHKRWGRRQ